MRLRRTNLAAEKSHACMNAFAGEKYPFLVDFTLEKAGRDPHSYKNGDVLAGRRRARMQACRMCFVRSRADACVRACAQGTYDVALSTATALLYLALPSL
jgi:hypothetical protein